MKNTVHNITTPKAGENITESYLAALTQAANRSNTILGYNGVEGSASTRQTPYVNPLMVRVRNTTNETVDQYHVLRVTDPFYTQSGAYPQAGKAFDNYIRGSLPTDEDGEEFVIVDRDCPPSGEAPAVISGPSFCKILVETGNEDCKFAKTKENEKYLVAADSGPARIVWKETGIGEKWAFVVLGCSTKTTLKCVYENPNTETDPPASFDVDGTKTFISSNGNEFSVEGVAGVKLFNPIGFPDKRPVIVASVTGFPADSSGTGSVESNGSGGSEETTSGGSEETTSGETQLTAVSCDVRELIYFSGPESSSGTGTAAGIQAGDLYYVEWSATNRRWEPMAGSTGTGSGSGTGNDSSPEGSGTGNDSSSEGAAVDAILAVCQKSVPAEWNAEYYMPFYTPEQNYGKYPKRGSTAGERCGVILAEREFSNKRIDYEYKNKRYSYEPIFTFRAQAKGTAGSSGSGSGGGVKISIEQKDYDVTFETPSEALFQPDVYVDDWLIVRVDASGDDPTVKAVTFPSDYREDTLLFMPNTVSLRRGWIDFTSEFMDANCVGEEDLWVFRKKQTGLERTQELATFGGHYDPKDYYVPERRTEGTDLAVSVWPVANTTAVEGAINPNPHDHNVPEQDVALRSGKNPAHEKLTLHNAPIRVWKKVKTGALV